MATSTYLAESPEVTPQPRWSLATKLAFQICFVYFILYCLTTQIFGNLIGIPIMETPDPSLYWPVHPVILFTAKYIFRLKQTLVEADSGSGDKWHDWVLAFCTLVFALLVAAIWSYLDRRRPGYPGLNKWFRVLIRFALVSQMFSYGMAKVFPLQMSFPSLQRLLQPIGQMSPMGMLWTFIGASTSYEVICGSVELFCGVLLVFPRTTLFGALFTAGVASQIFILNMTYDVPVKLFSFQLIIMAMFLAAPDLSRLIAFFQNDRVVAPSVQPSLFVSARKNRWALVVQIVFGLWLLGGSVYSSMDAWPKYGGGQPKSNLYGIWQVTKFSIDGHERSALLNDYGRWKRVVFDYPDAASYQRMDESNGYYNTRTNLKDQTIALTDGEDKKWKGSLHYDRPSPDHLLLKGDLGGHPVDMQLELYDRNKFTLVSRGFHWVQEYPFHR